MKVEIPFQERWREAMLVGKKTCTSRTKQYGSPGDRFEAFGATFELGAINKVELGKVTFAWFEAEGCSSSQEFMEVWCDLHPKGWNPFQQVYAHLFYRVEVIENGEEIPTGSALDLLRCSAMADLGLNDPGSVVIAFKMLYRMVKELQAKHSSQNVSKEG